MPPADLLHYGTRTLSKRAWARERGIPMSTLQQRLAAKWPLGEALGFLPHGVPRLPAPPRPVPTARVAQPMRWCPTHERAWCVSMHDGPHWHPLTRVTLWLALTYARAFGCAGGIVVEEVACSECEKGNILRGAPCPT